MIKQRQSELPFQLNVNIIRGKKQTNLASTSANSSASLFKTIEINSNENKL
jgi:predicted membrane GTPase involved in stress response